MLKGAAFILKRFKTAFWKIDHDFKTFGTQQVFDKIYRQKIWGKSVAGELSSGDGSHTPAYVAPYVEAVVKLLNATPNKPSMVDLGCGDFSVGYNFAEYVSHLTACDISAIVIRFCKEKYPQGNLSFEHLNISQDPLPSADIACVRQVLQHLSNQDIRAFTHQLNTNTPYKMLIVTEHIAAAPAYEANKDKITGPSTRVSLNSGVDLACPPFNLISKSASVLVEIDHPCDGRSGILRTTLYTF